MLTTRRDRFLTLALTLCLSLLTISVAGGCESKITDANFARITQGMTQSDVDAILGSGDDESVSGFSISGGGIAGTKDDKVKVFRYKDTRAGTAIVVTYHGDKVHEVIKVGF